jgi:cytochrome c-type biogenesis protein CcsB
MSLGELSTILVWGATTAYAIALVAFAIDLARLADGHVAQSIPAMASGSTGASTAVLDGPASGRGGVPGRRSGKAVGIAMATTTLGLALHVVGTLLRGLAAGRVPWANMYEFTLVGSLAAVATFLVICRRRDLRFLGTIVLGLTVLALGLGLAAFYVPAEPVEPALQSYWLVIHVSIATASTGLFAVSFAASALQLLKDSRDGGTSGPVAAVLAGRRWRMLDALPTTRELEALSFRITAVGFVLWTFTLIAGAIWAEHAWGRYWGWDPKEVWTFVVWVVYAAYLHARTTRGWSGRRAAWFVIIGFAAVLFNFTGVNLLFNGKHSYSGLPTDPSA